MTRTTNRYTIVFACLALVLSMSPVAADHHEGKAGAMEHKGLQFAPVAEGSPVEIAVLWGDPAVGPVAVMLKLPPNHRNPVHTHSANYTAVMVEGSLQQWDDGESPEKAKVLKAGASAKQKAGNYHAELVGSDGAMIFVYFDGPIDIKPKESMEE